MIFSSSRRLFRRDPVPGDAKPICLLLHMQNRTQKVFLPVYPLLRTPFHMPQVSPPVSRLLRALSRMRKMAPHLPFFSIRRDLKVP